jgi:hypothetical protein
MNTLSFRMLVAGNWIFLEAADDCHNQLSGGAPGGAGT